MKHALTIFLGALLIAIITPLAQFSTLAMTNHDMETSAASGWAFGLLFAFILSALVLRLITRKPWLNRGQVVLVFAMLTIAVPVMNLGLIRPLFLMLRTTQLHYVNLGVDTYRSAYQEQSPDWFPVVPTTEGLAHHKADRLLRLLNDDPLARRRQSALSEFQLALQLEERRRDRGEEVRPEIGEALRDQLGSLGLMEVERLRQSLTRDEDLAATAEALGLQEEVESLYTRLQAESTAALDVLLPRIVNLDERTLYFAPSLRRGFDRGIRGRLATLLERLPEEEANLLLAQGREVDGQVPELRAALMRMGERDRGALLRARREAYLRVFEGLNSAEIAELRAEFIFRSRTQERRTLYGQRAEGDVPGHDLSAMDATVFRSSQEKDDFMERSFRGRIAYMVERIPWAVWKIPLVRWSALFVTIFLFLMCMAEWLRRKWVERENLAFPLVEIADQLIRHDFRLETAEDLLNPERRRGLFSGVFWAGFALGMLILIVEAMGYYGPGDPTVVAGDMNERLLSNAGVLRELNSLFLCSPRSSWGCFFSSASKSAFPSGPFT